MAAHCRELKRVAVGHTIGLAKESERVLDAMPLETGAAGAFLGLVQSGADVDGKAEVGLPQFLDEGNDLVGIVKNRGDCAWTRDAIHNTIKVSFRIAAPVYRGIQFLRGTEDAAMARVAHVDRIVLPCDLQESPLLLDGALVVNSARGDGKDDVIIVEALAAAIAM